MQDISRPSTEYPVEVTLLVSFIVFRLRLKRRFTLNATDTSCACKTNPILSAVGGLQMNVSIFYTKDYENKSDWTLGENKPNSKPIQTQSNPICRMPKMSVNSILAKDYERNDIFAVPQNKANTNPIQTQTNPISAGSYSLSLALHFSDFLPSERLLLFWILQWLIALRTSISKSTPPNFHGLGINLKISPCSTAV